MLKHFLKYACMAAPVYLLSGCGSTYSLKEFTPLEGQPKTAFIDIKQRAILSGRRVEKNGSADTHLIMCAEPSPDALSSLATELAADAKYKELVQSTLSFSQQEAASFVGLRTQTIQLLRDGMYRLCEGYMTGALNQADFAWLSRRYQRNMVALLTIEQLTRVAQVSTVGLSSQGLSSTAKPSSTILADIKQIDEQLAVLATEKERLSAEKTNAESLADSDQSKKTKISDAQNKLDANDQSTKASNEIRTTLLDSIKNPKGLNSQGSNNAQNLNQNQEQRPIQNESIAKSIAEITDTVLKQDDLPTLCFQILDGSRGVGKVDPGLKNVCLELVKSQVAIQNANADYIKEQTKKVASQSSNHPKNTNFFSSKNNNADFLQEIIEKNRSAMIIDPPKGLKFNQF